MALLRMLDDPDGRTFGLDGTLTIGRATDNSVVLADDAQVSRQHAEIAPSGAVYVLVDLGSSNGTRVTRGERTWQVAPDLALQDGDVIQVGASRFQFEAGAATQVGMAVGAETVVGRVIPPR